MKTTTKTPLAAALAATLAAFAAAAQQPADAPPAMPPAAEPAAETAAQDKDTALERVVVTSQGRREFLQSVPVAVKAFSAKQIEDTGVRSTQDFINLTPNMSFDTSYTYANSFVVIRGVSQINNADSPVAVVVDGVPQSDQKQLKMNLVDVDRIEVLKGPQGSLYGRNAIGGAIVIDTKPPTDELSGFARLDYSSGNTVEASGGVSGALVPSLVRFRLVGQHKSSDGLITNDYLHQNVDYISYDDLLRGKLTILASDDITLDIRGSANRFKGGATWDSLVRSGDLKATVNPAGNILGQTTGYNNEFTVKADIETALGTLTSITNRTWLREKYIGENDWSNPDDPVGGIIGTAQRGQGKDRHTVVTSQELRLTSPGSKPLRWIAGVYYQDRTMDFLEKSFADLNGQISQYDAAPALRNTSFGSKAMAGFGQIEYDINPLTKINGGLRYDRDARTRDNLITPVHDEQTFSAWQPKLTLTRKLGADAIGYATYSTGFRSGGFNPVADQPTFKAENLRNFELGYKSTVLDRRLTFNVAAFYSESRDYQYYFVKVLPNGSLSGRIGNIDEVHIKGLDADFRYTPFKGLEFDGGVGVTDSRIAANAAEPSTIGNWTPKASPWKVTFGSQYTAPVAATLLGFARFDVEARSKKYYHPDNVIVSDGLVLLNARFGVRDASGKWSATLYGRNLGNKHYYADANGRTYSGWPAPIPAIGSLASPRVVGLELSAKM